MRVSCPKDALSLSQCCRLVLSHMLQIAYHSASGIFTVAMMFRIIDVLELDELKHQELKHQRLETSRVGTSRVEGEECSSS